MIPVFDIKRQNQILKKELNQAIDSVIDNGVFILGQKVKEFEKEFADYIGVKYAIGSASGTDAISLALLAVGVGRGDEVVMPANSYPSAFAVTQIGAVPKLVDIDPETFNISVSKIPDAISRKTKAILPVHLYGQPADMEKIMGIGRKYNIPVVEDCAQAHGAEFRMQECKNGGMDEWRRVGSISDAGCFSFYPTKNLGCFGDGGMVVTNNSDIAEKVRLLRMYGEESRYNSILLGRNSRLDELQAAILSVKLKYLDKWNKRRREIASFYLSYFAGPAARVSLHGEPIQGEPKTKLQNPLKNSIGNFSVSRPVKLEFESPSLASPTLKNNKHVYHLFVIRTERRDELKDYLGKRGIQTAIHYPRPIHLQTSFKYLGYNEGDFPEAERACREILSLPMYPELTDEEIKVITGEISSFNDL